MISKLKYSWAINTLIVVPCALIIFHIFNLLGLIPINIVWTGRVSSDTTMYLMGLLSILLNVAILFCALVKAKYIKGDAGRLIVEKLLPIMFWWLVGNTIANLFSKSSFEVIVFTPILIILTICCYRIKDSES